MGTQHIACEQGAEWLSAPHPESNYEEECQRPPGKWSPCEPRGQATLILSQGQSSPPISGLARARCKGGAGSAHLGDGANNADVVGLVVQAEDRRDGDGHDRHRQRPNCAHPAKAPARVYTICLRRLFRGCVAWHARQAAADTQSSPFTPCKAELLIRDVSSHSCSSLTALRSTRCSLGFTGHLCSMRWGHGHPD